MTSIINQIQASITGEAIDNLDIYDEMQCNEKKIECIQDKTQTPPQTKT
jgi:hypothetical protein